MEGSGTMIDAIGKCIYFRTKRSCLIFFAPHLHIEIEFIKFSEIINTKIIFFEIIIFFKIISSDIKELTSV